MSFAQEVRGGWINSGFYYAYLFGAMVVGLSEFSEHRIFVVLCLLSASRGIITLNRAIRLRISVSDRLAFAEHATTRIGVFDLFAGHPKIEAFHSPSEFWRPRMTAALEEAQRGEEAAEDGEGLSASKAVRVGASIVGAAASDAITVVAAWLISTLVPAL